MFQWWSYTVSHGQLLLRSTKASARASQIDVLFKNVTEVQLETTLYDLQVSQEDPEGSDPSPEGTAKTFIVNSRSGKGYIRAGAVFHIEGGADYHEESPLLVRFPP